MDAIKPGIAHTVGRVNGMLELGPGIDISFNRMPIKAKLKLMFILPLTLRAQQHKRFEQIYILIYIG